MVLEEIYMISQVVAAFAVVASLVFVGRQMRQSDTTQQALMHQARTDRHIQIGMNLLDPTHLEMYKKSMEGDARQLSDKEVEYLIGLTRMGMLNTEDIVWQCKRGFLDESVLEDQRRIITQMMAHPAQRTVWRMTKMRFSSDLVAFVEEIERDTPLISKSEDRKQQYLQCLEQIEREASGQTND